VRLRLQIIFTMSCLALWGVVPNAWPASTADSLFKQGIEAYHTADFARAAQAFRDSLARQPAAGTLLNLGVVEWRRGRAGQAIQAWEQALWIDPYDGAARGNLDFARTVVQLDLPDRRWYEIASMWLPPSAWAWLASGSLWLAVAMMTLPRVRRWRKSGWHQGLAALGLGVFLLSIPALIGLATRSRTGIVLDRNTPLRLTPTEEAESITSLAAGETVRQVRVRRDFVFVRTPRDSGWIKREQFGPICPKAE
jgi:tetratricopeptide (TPR) repeat protein